MPKGAKQRQIIHSGNVPKPFPSWTWFRDCDGDPSRLPRKMRLCSECGRKTPPVYFASDGVRCIDCAIEPNGDINQSRPAPKASKNIWKKMVVEFGRRAVDIRDQRLSYRQREAVRLVYAIGCRRADAARRMKVSQSTLAGFLERVDKAFESQNLPMPSQWIASKG